MGQAKQRGTYEQRLAAAQDREAIAAVERKRIAAEREAEYRRLDEEAGERRFAAQEARRQERIAAGVDPDEMQEQRAYSAFGRRRGLRPRSQMALMLAAGALVASASSVYKTGGQQ